MKRTLAQRAAAVAGPAWELSVGEVAWRDLAADQSSNPQEETALDPSANLLSEAAAGESEPAKLDRIVYINVDASVAAFKIALATYDVPTQLWRPAVRRQVGRARDLPQAAATALVDAFAPLAAVESVVDKQATLRLKAWALPRQQEGLEFVRIGDVFQPVLRVAATANRPAVTRVVDWTFLVVQRIDGSLVRCRVISALRRPLSARRRGRTQQLALGIGTTRGTTDLQLKARGKDRVLAGYAVYAHPPDESRTELVGRTDDLGQVRVARSESPLRVLLVKSSDQFIARLPVVPGLSPYLVAELVDDEARLEAEAFLAGVQEEMVDQLARREKLLAGAGTLLGEGQFDEAREVLDQLERLKTRDEFALALRIKRRSFGTVDRVTAARIARLFDDTDKLLDRCFDVDFVANLRAQIAAAEEGAAAPTTAPTDSETSDTPGTITSAAAASDS